MSQDHAMVIDAVDTDRLSVTWDTDTLADRLPDKTARDVARDQIREARQYHQQIEHTTTSIVRKPIVVGTSRFYTTVLHEWDLFVAEYHGAKDPTNLKTAKDFVLYFTQGRQGRNERGGRLTRAYTYTMWKSFMAAWSRRYHTSFTRGHQDTILNFIKGGEAGSPNLSGKIRTKRNFTREDFLVCVMQLWQNDWHDFDHERYRVGLHLLLLLHCNTSARRAEFEREWTYADINVSVVWLDEAKQPQLVIDFQRTKAKGLRDWESEQPQHMLYELVNLPFYCNSVLFFMAAVLADDALRDYHSWDDICAIPKPDQQKHITLHWHPDKTDWPIFPRSLGRDQLDHTRTSASLTSQALVDLGHRAGFQDNVVLHAARREVLLQVDNYGYSCNERMRFAAHVNSDTYRRSYQTVMPMVDGQASYFQFAANGTELHDLRRSYGWRRNPYHQPILKEALRHAALENNESEVDSEENGDSNEDGDDQDREASLVDVRERQRDYDQRRHQRDRLIREQNKQAEPSESQAWVYESNFSQTRKLMPERDRLASTLFYEGSLRDEVGREVMRDLIALCGTRTRKTYCTTLNQSGQVCDTCGLISISGKEHTWWWHVYQCRKRSQKSTGGFAEFCFLCFQWCNDSREWVAHTRVHLDQPPLQCSMATFRHNIIRPGLCPTCLGQGKYHQHLNLTTWKRHIQDHVLHGKSNVCPHPRCRQLAAMSSRVNFLNHLADIHDIRLDKAKRQKALRVSATPDSTRQPIALSYLHTGVDYFAKLSLYDEGKKLAGRQPQHQPVRQIWAADVEVGASDDVVNGVDKPNRGSEALTASEQRDSSIQSGCIAVGDGNVRESSNGVSCAIVHTPQDRSTSDGNTETCDTTEYFRHQHHLASSKIQQECSRQKTRVMVNVPPVPDSWRNVPLLADADENVVVSPTGKVTSSSVAHLQPRRGRPPGSRNRTTLRRGRRLTSLTKTVSR